VFGQIEPDGANITPWNGPSFVAFEQRPRFSTLMFAASSGRHENAFLACERFRMAAAEQGRRRDHQNDG
jgi:hypothetical protein